MRKIIRDELRNREVYSKFVECLNKEQPVLLIKRLIVIYAERVKTYREKR